MNTDLIQREFDTDVSRYFNSAAIGVTPQRSKHKVETVLQWELRPSQYDFELWQQRPDSIRLQLAQLLGASEESIAHGTSVTDFISLIAQVYPLKKTDAVVAMKGDYPSLVLPWMVAQQTRSFQFCLLDQDCFFEPEKLIKVLPAQTRVLNISQTMFNTGRRLDIEAIGKICRERDILYIVDGTQSFGGTHLEKEILNLIDIYTCSTYKWMLGAYGHAFAYFSSKALEETPRMTGSWLAAANSEDLNNLLQYTLDTLPGARKFDRGQVPNSLVLAALEGALEVLLEVGLKNAEAHNHALAQHFYQELPREHCRVTTPEGFENIVCFEMDEKKLESFNSLIESQEFSVSFREGSVRNSFHIFNHKNNVDEYLGLLREL